MTFKRNIGALDMLLRTGLSAAAIYIGFIDQGIIPDSLSSMIIGGLGVLNMIVALARFCPLYSIAGINTCKLS